MSKDMKLKCFTNEGVETSFDWTGSNTYNSMEDFELAKQTFISNKCVNCSEGFNKEDFLGGNYELGINRKQSFFNLDEFNPNNKTKLEVVFHITNVSHKECVVKAIHQENTKEENKIIIPDDFLQDKEYGITEEPDNYILNVRYNGRVFSASVSKKRAFMFKEQSDMKIVIVNLVLATIRLQIKRAENMEKLIKRRNTEGSIFYKKNEEDE